MNYDELMDCIDQQERLVHELSEELREYDEDTIPWQLCLDDLNDAENELVYYQERRDTGDYDD